MPWNIMLNEIGHEQKDKYHMMALLSDICNRQINKDSWIEISRGCEEERISSYCLMSMDQFYEYS